MSYVPQERNQQLRVRTIQPLPRAKTLKLLEPLHEQSEGLVSLKQVLSSTGHTARNIDDSRFVTINGISHYRHWHFPGGEVKFPGKEKEPKIGEEVHIPVTPSYHGTRLITPEHAAYIQEQETMKANNFVSLSTINARVEAVEPPVDRLHPISINFVRRMTRKSSKGEFFSYYAISEANGSKQAPRKKMYYLMSGKTCYFSKTDAETIIENEIFKRRNFYHIGKVADDLGVSLIALHSRLRSGSLDGVKGGSCWFVRKSSADNVRASKHVDLDIPDNAVLFGEFVDAMPVSRRYVENKTYPEPDGTRYFEYETIEKGRVISRKIRVYVAASQDKYVGAEDLAYVKMCERRVRRWPTFEQFSENTGVTEQALIHNQDHDHGTTKVYLDHTRYVDVRYVLLRARLRLHPVDSSEVAEFLRLKSISEIVPVPLPKNVKQRMRTHIGLRRIPGANKLLRVHVDPNTSTLHLTEGLRLCSSNGSTPELKHVEYYNIGIPCKIYNSGNRHSIIGAISIDRRDAELVEFYVGMLKGSEDAKKRLELVRIKLENDEQLTVNDILIAFIARFVFMQVHKESSVYLDERLELLRRAKRNKFIDLVQRRIFNERTMARIPERFWVKTRLGAYEALSVFDK